MCRCCGAPPWILWSASPEASISASENLAPVPALVVRGPRLGPSGNDAARKPRRTQVPSIGIPRDGGAKGARHALKPMHFRRLLPCRPHRPRRPRSGQRHPPPRQPRRRRRQRRRARSWSSALSWSGARWASCCANTKSSCSPTCTTVTCGRQRSCLPFGASFEVSVCPARRSTSMCFASAWGASGEGPMASTPMLRTSSPSHW
mmetsp:Transcript_22340/g.64008  ORF Transcript_22340/g.64008 Transcript_22340/m.64008 type:complete len:204 (+) Transcript_22340:638-1249(+)